MDTKTVEHGHEGRDVSVRTILLLGAGLVGLAAAIQVVLFFQMGALWRARQK